MGYKFSEEQKAQIAQYKSLKSSKTFQQFLKNMGVLLDPEKNTIMKYVSENEDMLPGIQPLRKYDIKSESDTYTKITPSQLLAKASKLVSLINIDDLDENKEYDTEDALNRAFAKVQYPVLFADIKRVFDDKYNSYMSSKTEGKMTIVDMVCDKKMDLETYRLFTMGKVIMDEISELSEKALQEQAYYDSIEAKHKILKERKPQYQHQQDMLFREMEAFKEKASPSYQIAEKTVVLEDKSEIANGIITKEDVLNNAGYFDAESTIFEDLTESLDAQILAEKEKRLELIKKNARNLEEKLKEAEDKYSKKVKSIKDSYSAEQMVFDELSEKLKKEVKFSEYDEYKDLQTAIKQASIAETENVEDEYILNFSQAEWAYEFDRESLGEYDEEIANVNRQIEDLENKIAKGNTWIETAKEAYQSAQKVSDLRNHIDEIIGEKGDMITTQSALVAKFVQDNDQKRNFSFYDIPDAAFSTATLNNLKIKGRQQYDEFLKAQKAVKDALSEKEFGNIIKDLEKLVSENKILQQPLYNRQDLGFGSTQIEQLKMAFAQNNPEDPEKFDITRGLKLIEITLSVYEKGLAENSEINLSDLNEQSMQADRDAVQLRTETEANLKRMKELKERASWLEKQYKLDNEELDRSIDRTIKEVAAQNKQAAESTKIELREWGKERKGELSEKLKKDLQENEDTIRLLEERNKEIEAGLQKLDALKINLENDIRNVPKIYEGLRKNLETYKNRYANLASKVNDSFNCSNEYLDTISEVFKENEKLRVENIELLKSLPKLQKYAAEDIQNNKRDVAYSNEDLERLQLDINTAEENNKKHTASIEYLKTLKDGYEAGKAWLGKKAKLKHTEDKRLLEEYRTKLNERDRQLRKETDIKVMSLQSRKEEYQKELDKIDRNSAERISRFEEYKNNVKKLKADTAHARRTVTALRENAKALIDAKKIVNDDLKAERDFVQAHYTEKMSKYDAEEDRLMNAVINSRKAWLSNSGLFNDVVDQIKAYREAKAKLSEGNNELSPGELEAFKKRTKDLNAEIAKYISKRYDPIKPKKTREGQIRLDAMMDLQRVLAIRESDLLAYKVQVKELDEKVAAISIKPKSELEAKSLKNENAEKDLSKDFFDAGTNVPGNETAPLTEEQKQKIDEEDNKLDAEEEAKRGKDPVNVDMQKLDSQANEIKKNTEAYFKELHDKSVVIPEIHYSQFYLNPEMIEQYLPPDLWAVAREFNNLTASVPADYGFAEYNKGKFFFQRISLEEYENRQLGQEQFMKDNHIISPIPNKQDILNVLRHDMKITIKDIAYRHGYKEDFLEKIANNSDSDELAIINAHSEKNFLKKKFDLKDEDAFQQFLVQERRKIGKEMGLEDPRLSIKNYGSYYDMDAISNDQIQRKLEEAKASAKLREKITKEIEKYDRMVSKISPYYGFDEYIKKKDVLPLDKYIKSGQGSMLYAEENNLKKPVFNGPEGKETPEYKKELEAYTRLLENNRRYGYEAEKKRLENLERVSYGGSGVGKELYLRTHPKYIDPRITYSLAIRKDKQLLQKYRPDLVQDITVGPRIMNNQLDEYDNTVEYENNALKIIKDLTNYKEEAKKPTGSILDQKQSFEGNYFDGFEKYPDDLKEKIREYDMIRASVPKDYNYNEFEKKVDFRHKYSRERYIAEGMGWKYFADMHRIVDPRIPLEVAERIRKYDSQLGSDKPEISFDPRSECPNYGRILLNKEQYKERNVVLFDDSERLARNKMILDKMKEFVEKIKQVPADFGFEPYKEGDNIEEYVTRREYKMSDEPVRIYMLVNNIENPLTSFKEDISVDSELKSQINELTADYRTELTRKRSQYQIEPLPPEEQKLYDKREARRAKMEEELTSLAKDINQVDDMAFEQLSKWVNKRANLRRISNKQREKLGEIEDVVNAEKTIEEFTKNINETLANIKLVHSPEYREKRINQIHIKNYCDRLTINDIEREEKEFEKFEELIGGQENIFGFKREVPISDTERLEYGLRQKRVEELKEVKNVLDMLEKSNPKLVSEIKADEKKLEEFTNNVISKKNIELADIKAPGVAPSKVQEAPAKEQAVPVKEQARL